MQLKQVANWYFPPTRSKRGETKYKYGRIPVILLESDLFGHPVVALSDAHSQTPELVIMMDELLNLDQFVVLTCGDMAGSFQKGSDGNPTPEYIYLNKRAKEFYFVQGNHDLPAKKNAQNLLKNKQGNLCGIPNGKVVQTPIGTIGGVNGIISNKQHAYKMPAEQYHEHLKQTLAQKPTILMTHDTPSIPAFYETTGDRYVGNGNIFDIVDKYKPKVHFYGHCHHPAFYKCFNEVHYFNVDARVLIIVPPGDTAQLFKKQLEDKYSPNAQKLYIDADEEGSSIEFCE